MGSSIRGRLKKCGATSSTGYIGIYDYAIFPSPLIPDVSGRPQVLLMLERLLGYIAGRKGVKIVRMEEMADDYAQHFHAANGIMVERAMCGLCGMLGSEVHWSDASRPTADEEAASERRRERRLRVVASEPGAAQVVLHSERLARPRVFAEQLHWQDRNYR